MNLNEPKGGRGRPSELLQIAPDCGYTLGVEFGQKHIIYSVLDAVGRQIYWGQQPSVLPYRADDMVMDGLVDAARRIVGELQLPWEKVGSVGVAVHDVVTAGGEWIPWQQAQTMPYNAARYLEAAFMRPVTIEDISRASAEAEHRYGSGRGLADFIYLFVGDSGIGSGIFINNNLMKSSSGVCGEIGHLVVEADGQLCQCGNYGCLETIALPHAVISQLQSVLLEDIYSHLNTQKQLTFADVCRAAQEGDKHAYIALRRQAVSIATALTYVINITGASSVLLGGELRHVGESYLADLGSDLRQNVMPALVPRVEVRHAELHGYAGAMGVAAQALDLAWDSGQFLA